MRFQLTSAVHHGRQKTPRGEECLRTPDGAVVTAHLLIVCTDEPYLVEPRPPKAGNGYAAWVRVRLGRLTLTVFVVLQIADGLMTFGAVRIFGTAAEGNPILETWIQLAGPGATLLGAKGIACGGAAVLYACGRQKTLAALTVVLLAGAVVPWLALLATFH